MPSRAERERYSFPDVPDPQKARTKRRAHHRLGFAVRLTSVRCLGRFAPDPRQVPAEVAEHLAEQWGIAGRSQPPAADARPDPAARDRIDDIVAAGTVIDPAGSSFATPALQPAVHRR